MVIELIEVFNRTSGLCYKKKKIPNSIDLNKKETVVWLSPFSVHLKLSQHCLLIGYPPIKDKFFKRKNGIVSFKKALSGPAPQEAPPR